EPALDQPSCEEGLTRIDNAECACEPGVPADREVRDCGCDNYCGRYCQARFRPPNDQRTYRDACSRPEDGCSCVGAKDQAELCCHEISDADRNGETDLAKGQLVVKIERERCPLALLSKHA